MTEPDLMTDPACLECEPEQELYEHFRFVADKGQESVRIDKFLTEHL